MDLSVKYLGYTLKNPIIIGSSGLTNTVGKIKKLAQNNAGAIVLKSLFEEQLLAEASHKNTDNYLSPEAYDYIQEYSKSNSFDQYLYLIEDARKAVDIPIIASINARTDGEWVEYAKKMEAAGAHAIELNISILPTNPDKDCKKTEKLHLKILQKVRKAIKIPIAIKISSYSSGIAHLIKEITWSKNANAIVMFNRFYNPDIDIEKLEITNSNVFSTPTATMPSLRWIAMLSDKFNIDLVGSTGIYTGDDVIKQILVGAKAVQIVSAIYKNGPENITQIINTIKNWMNKKQFKTINEYKGKLSLYKLENPNTFERIQFMKYFGTIK